MPSAAGKTYSSERLAFPNHQCAGAARAGALRTVTRYAAWVAALPSPASAGSRLSSTARTAPPRSRRVRAARSPISHCTRRRSIGAFSPPNFGPICRRRRHLEVCDAGCTSWSPHSKAWMRRRFGAHARYGRALAAPAVGHRRRALRGHGARCDAGRARGRDLSRADLPRTRGRNYPASAAPFARRTDRASRPSARRSDSARGRGRDRRAR